MLFSVGLLVCMFTVINPLAGTHVFVIMRVLCVLTAGVAFWIFALFKGGAEGADVLVYAVLRYRFCSKYVPREEGHAWGDNDQNLFFADYFEPMA